MSAGRALFKFVMEREGRALEVDDEWSSLMSDDVKATWEKEAAAVARPLAEQVEWLQTKLGVLRSELGGEAAHLPVSFWTGPRPDPLRDLDAGS